MIRLVGVRGLEAGLGTALEELLVAARRVCGAREEEAFLAII